MDIIGPRLKNEKMQHKIAPTQPLRALAPTKGLMKSRWDMEEGASPVLYPLCSANHSKNSINSFFSSP